VMERTLYWYGHNALYTARWGYSANLRKFYKKLLRGTVCLGHDVGRAALHSTLYGIPRWLVLTNIKTAVMDTVTQIQSGAWTSN
jgi:hypothetical protein